MVVVLSNLETEPWALWRKPLQKMTPVVQRIAEQQRVAEKARSVPELNSQHWPRPAPVKRRLHAVPEDTRRSQLLAFLARGQP